jgi:hypothetical protein
MQIVDKNSGAATVNIALSMKSKAKVTVPIFVSGSSTAKSPIDYSLGSTSVVIAAGDSTGTIHFSLVAPSLYEKSKAVIISLVAPTNAKLGALITDTVVIVDAKGFTQANRFADNEVPGWRQDNSSPDSIAVYTGEELITKLDGTADSYLLKGLLVSMYQNLTGPDDPQICTFTAMDFGASALADSEYVYQKSFSSVSIPEFDTSVAIAYPGMEGTGNITVFAHFNALYFELALSGYTDQTASCLAASQLLKAIQLKTN